MTKRTAEILKRLDEAYGTEYVCYLNHETPWQLLIAVILSAQCTDARVNIVTKDLFQKYPSLNILLKFSCICRFNSRKILFSCSENSLSSCRYNSSAISKRCRQIRFRSFLASRLCISFSVVSILFLQASIRPFFSPYDSKH